MVGFERSSLLRRLQVDVQHLRKQARVHESGGGAEEALISLPGRGSGRARRRRRCQ